MATVIYVTININFDVQKTSVCYLRGILRRKVMLRYPWGAALPSTYPHTTFNIIPPTHPGETISMVSFWLRKFVERSFDESPN
jgi:hypothetical protein